MVLFKPAQHTHRGKENGVVGSNPTVAFSFIRIVYFAFAIFGISSRFRYIARDVTVLLCMTLLQDVIVVLCMSVGLTLQKQFYAVVSHSQRVGGKDGESTLQKNQQAEPRMEQRKGLFGRLLPILHTTAFLSNQSDWHNLSM